MNVELSACSQELPCLAGGALLVEVGAVRRVAVVLVRRRHREEEEEEEEEEASRSRRRRRKRGGGGRGGGGRWRAVCGAKAFPRE